MEERNEIDKNIDDDMMPGFRFHPTDEEIVDFYLKRKIQQKSFPIELIKQVDIYKYEPWDLPKLASTGEKEWYFYCPRDRKYRNSPRPNRVTRAGFWKATGTDRPIYSSEGKCIGLKKSLVFYRGRAAKGMKTDWMMHEFRLPCLSDSPNSKKFSDKSIPTSESWAICRIFKKTNSMSMAQKALSHPWISQLPGTLVSDMITQSNNVVGNGSNSNNNQFCSENISCTTQLASSSSAIQFCNNTNFSEIPSSYRPIINNTGSKSLSQNNTVLENGDLAENFIINSSMFSNSDCIGFEEPNQNQYSGFSINLQQDMQQNIGTDNHNVNTCPVQINHQWESTGRSSIGFPFILPPNDVWNNNNKGNVASWDSSPPCPSDMSTSYSTNKCYT